MGLSKTYILVPVLLAALLDLSLGLKLLLTLPKEASYDVDLLASVSAFGVSPGQPETVGLEYRGLKDSSKVLNSTRLVFSSDGLQEWKVMFQFEQMKKLEETGVTIRMSCKNDVLFQNVSFSQNFGYIFIQTDKPIYSPRQTVRYRVLAVDEFQKLARYPIRIDIKNPKGILVDRKTCNAEEAFTAQELYLPDDVNLGVWSITASFDGQDYTAWTSHSVNFEVEEYVLPRFTCQVKVEPVIITEITKWITINVTARYVYGQPLLGSVKLQLGVENFLGLQMLPDNYTGQLVNGDLVQNIWVSQHFPSGLQSYIRQRLYIEAVATETASLETYICRDVSTLISQSYYVVDFQASRKFFKPGFPYIFQAEVYARRDLPPDFFIMYVKSTYLAADGTRIGELDQTIQGNGSSIVRAEFVIPERAETLMFEATVFNPKIPEFPKHVLNVSRYHSTNQQYLHLSLSAPVMKHQDGKVLILYTKPRQGDSSDQQIITVMVMSRGHMVYTARSDRNTRGQSQVTLPSHLYADLVPHMRIVAFYQLHNELVIDSLLVETAADQCLEELSLTVRDQDLLEPTSKPKESLVLGVDGGPSMHVGLVAVDKAVLLGKTSLTRELMFQQLASHDTGEGSGDGANAQEILKNSGLVQKEMNSCQGEEIPVPSGALSPVGSWPIYEELGKQHTVGKNKPVSGSNSLDKLQTVRHYFPESWLFEERRLPSSGRLDLNLTLPDSITTWSFLALGISASRGICVSQPLERSVQKPFFADVRLPFKATRLEEVKVKIVIYNFQNYAIAVKGLVTGVSGLCFSANLNSQENRTQFSLRVEPGQARQQTIKVIPLQTGDLTLRAELQNQIETDIIEKKLYVVAEGQRVERTLTFVLDPEGKHATFKPSKKNRTILVESYSLKNVVDLANKEQQTKVDLALPSNFILGTESCQISACGDLMGDIIHHFVIESRSRMQSVNINRLEDVLAELVPTVHALLSANVLKLLDSQLRNHSYKFVKRGYTKLLKYREAAYFVSGSSSRQKYPSTWLTTFALKSLCHIKDIIFVDETIILGGFSWLRTKVQPNGTLQDKDWRQGEDHREYSIMLSAEVVIAFCECRKSFQSDDTYTDPKVATNLDPPDSLVSYLESKVEQIKEPNTLAKVSYALLLVGRNNNPYLTAVKRLLQMKRKNKYGQIYWYKMEIPEERKPADMLRYKQIHASAIEASAYALMVILQQAPHWVDAVADWLVGHREYTGSFIGALDSSAATQALSKYSLQKHKKAIDLHCNVSTEQHRQPFFSFAFTKENAIQRESFDDAPVGQVLEILTRGQGLGQMQVHIEYNVPIEKAKSCPFTIYMEVKKTTFKWSMDMNTNPLCTTCNIGCPQPATQQAPAPGPTQPASNITLAPAAKMRVKVPRNKTRQQKPQKNKGSSSKNTRKQPSAGAVLLGTSNNLRKQRSVGTPATSKKSICIHVCLKHLQDTSQAAELRIEMLTGFRPVQEDIEKIAEASNVILATYDMEREVVIVHFKQVTCTKETCVAFRAVDEEEASRLNPAKVEVALSGTSGPQCVQEYWAPDDAESLKVFCARNNNTNRGECLCYSGNCSICQSDGSNTRLSLHDMKQLFCSKPVVYQLQIAEASSLGNWAEIDSKVVSAEKIGADNVTAGSIIKLMTPHSCSCPLRFYTNQSEPFYFLSSDVIRLMDGQGHFIHRYLLDQRSVFVQIGTLSSSILTTSRFNVEQARRDLTKC